MAERFITIWFPHLATDWFTLRQPALKNLPFVLAAPDHGRLVINAANALAQSQGVNSGMVVADARAILPALEVFDDKPDLSTRLLTRIAEWCIRYTPIVAADPPDGLTLNVTGCAHLWGGEEPYLREIMIRLKGFGYNVRSGMADTIGAAWAIARFGSGSPIIASGRQEAALKPLPAEGLRPEAGTLERLQKLGLRHIGNILCMPRAALRRRFGEHLVSKLNQALGLEEEVIEPVHPIEPFQERLPCLEPIVTAGGIEIALQRLLEILCTRLQQDQKGLRVACFKGYRVDGRIEKIEIGTSRASHHTGHLFKLFELKLPTIEPALGIELFTLEAPKVEELSPFQARLWEGSGGLADIALAELIDRLENRIGPNHVHRYLPDEHHWPERSIKHALSLQEKSTTPWGVHRPRPLQLLSTPEAIEVTAPVPDYPPMLFRYKGRLHKIKKADGPERIEQEWWLEEGQHRDYYAVEDEEGCRYWLFRSGHYSSDKPYQWFMHGFFA